MGEDFNCLSFSSATNNAIINRDFCGWKKQEHLLCHLLKHIIKLEQSGQWGPWRRPCNKKGSLETDQVYTQIFYIRYMDEEWVIPPRIPEHMGYLSKLALHLKCIHSKRIPCIQFSNTKRTRKNMTLDKCSFQWGRPLPNLTPKGKPWRSSPIDSFDHPDEPALNTLKSMMNRIKRQTTNWKNKFAPSVKGQPELNTS